MSVLEGHSRTDHPEEKKRDTYLGLTNEQDSAFQSDADSNTAVLNRCHTKVSYTRRSINGSHFLNSGGRNLGTTMVRFL